MIAAPFLALLYGPDAGLAVAAAALAATAYLAWDASRRLPPAARQRMQIAAVVNAGLAVAAAILLGVRILSP